VAVAVILLIAGRQSWPAPPGGASRSMQSPGERSCGRGCRSAGGAAVRWAGLAAGQRTGLLCWEERQSCRERKDQLLPFRQRAVIQAGVTRGAVARQSCSGRAAEISFLPSCALYAGAEGLEQSGR
jgi:hypothetical protein